MDDGGAVDRPAAAGVPRLLSGHGGRHGTRARRRRGRCHHDAVVLAACAAVRPAVAVGAGTRHVGQPLAARRAAARGLRSGRAGSAPRRAADLALLRDVRDAGGQHAAARQFPGRPEAGCRAPDVAHQHGTLSALRGRGPRLRLGRHDRDRRAAGNDDRVHADARALQGALLQLVRHPRPAGARSALCLVRRQRQPRRLPARARQRLRGVDRRLSRAQCAVRHDRPSPPGA